MAVELFGCDLNILQLFRLNIVLGFNDFTISIPFQHISSQASENQSITDPLFGPKIANSDGNSVRRFISILPQGFWKALRCYTETSGVLIRNKCLELSFSPFDPRGTSCGEHRMNTIEVCLRDGGE